MAGTVKGPGRPGRERADKLLVERGLVPTRQRAQALILAGVVLAGDRPVEKAGDLLPVDVELRLRGEDHPYVSRGGLKLAHAIAHFQLAKEIAGAVCLDAGASTGGFTDCLLQQGAARVFAVDVGYGQLAWKLRVDPRVTVIERQNIRHLAPEAITAPLDLAVADLSFISLTLVLGKIAELLGPGKPIVALIKPQFELSPADIGKGGVVRDPDKRAAAIERIRAFLKEQGWRDEGVVESPITGPAGNVEYLILIRT